MARTNTSVLGYALLGLIHGKVQSGYDLRKLLADTAMGSFSDSPGAIYPALARLEKQGLISGAIEEKETLRRRRLYHLTRQGKKALQDWVLLPITRDDIMRRQGELMLRFAFIEGVFDANAAMAFLKKMRDEVEAYLPELKTYLKTNHKKMPLSAMLALDSGIRGYAALREWTRYGIKLYSQKQK